jgi:hypothetical protein
MKKLIFAILIAIPTHCLSQKIKGVVTYMDANANNRPNIGERVYLIPCKKYSGYEYNYINTYTLNKALYRLNPGKLSALDKDTLGIYHDMIDSLKGRFVKNTLVDGSGNYTIEGVKAGSYLILFECLKCEGYKYDQIEIKAKETVSSDQKFLCF